MTMRGKKLIAQGLYESGWLEVYFNPRVEGVLVPEHIKGLDHVKFDYGTSMPVPIEDLDIGDLGISATLSFNRTPFKTFLPWDAVFTMQASTPTLMGGAAWPMSIPDSVHKKLEPEEAVEPAGESQAAVVGAPVPTPKRERPAWMRVV